MICQLAHRWYPNFVVSNTPREMRYVAEFYIRSYKPVLFIAFTSSSLASRRLFARRHGIYDNDDQDKLLALLSKGRSSN
jgi:hypothetical protein